MGALCLLAAESAAGQTVSVQECCLPLLVPYTARAVSLGETLTSRRSTDGLFYNPASLLGNGRNQFIIHHQETFEGQNNAFTILVNAGIAGAFGLTYVLVDQGEEEAFVSGPVPSGTIAFRHHQLIATYATSVTGGLRAGVSLKLYNFSVTCSGLCGPGALSSTAHMIDLGAQYQPGMVRGLELGLSLMHLGFPLQVVNAEQADETPARVRFGAAYEIGRLLQSDSTISVSVTGDVVDRIRAPGSPILGAGVEVSFDQSIFLRAGYSGAGDGLAKGGAGIGIGIRYERFTVGVAKSFKRSELETEGEPFFISFGIAF